MFNKLVPITQNVIAEIAALEVYPIMLLNLGSVPGNKHKQYFLKSHL